MEARRAGRRRRKGWAAAEPQRPSYSGRGHIVSPRAQLVLDVYHKIRITPAVVNTLMNYSQSGGLRNFRSVNADQWQFCTTARLPIRLLPPHTIRRYGGQAIAGTFFLCLPPDDIAWRRVSQHRLSSL